MKWVMYGNDGGINEVIQMLRKPKKKFKTVTDMFDELVKTRESIPSKQDLYMRYYGYDPRLLRDVYIILCNKTDNEEDHWLRFVSYAVEVED